MLYEVRTYTLIPNAIPEYEKRFAQGLAHREKFSKLAAFWHTDIGPLNQVIHVWPYNDLEERRKVRAAAVKEGVWPPKASELYVDTRSEVFTPAPFMRPLNTQKVGPIFEMRTYTYKVGAMSQVLKLWEERIAWREKLSPMVACWYSEFGELNRFVHIWAYKSLDERARIRVESFKDRSKWPAPTQEWLLAQENKIMLPASFSPVQ
ncbi:MAG: NIPSNAP family protein [SAR202 cluster bacterium]|nr:NIPSNAP family protein [SAR202 cluster bacterium]